MYEIIKSLSNSEIRNCITELRYIWKRWEVDAPYQIDNTRLEEMFYIQEKQMKDLDYVYDFKNIYNSIYGGLEQEIMKRFLNKNLN